MKLELYFTDRNGRRWTVWDWRVLAKKRCRIWPGMPESEWRTFVAEDGAETRHYRIRPNEGRRLVPEILAHQLSKAKLEVQAHADRLDAIGTRGGLGSPDASPS